MTAMIAVDEARAVVASAVRLLSTERVRLENATGRVLAEPVTALLSQPPFDASAMDGYAVRYADCAVGARFQVIGESVAGGRSDREVGEGTAVRIFTGAPVPKGADHVLIQEDVERSDDAIVVRARQERPEHIRRAGLDFRQGDVLAAAGATLTGALPALIAAGNVSDAWVRRRPRVALIANGDELALPGAVLEPDEIVCSIPFGLAPLIAGWGGSSEFLGIARDDMDEIATLIDRARDFDLIVPIGGASVGDRDLMRAAFEAKGYSELFAKIALKPGKPAWFGALGPSFVLGLPGNPASALVTARLFLRTAIRAMLGAPTAESFLRARAGAAINANGPRETYLRAILSNNDDGTSVATPFAIQDSSVLSVLARSDVLIRRLGHAPPCEPGGLVDCLQF